MRERTILVALSAAVLVLAFTAIYGAYVSASNHRETCASRQLVLNTLHDVIQLAFTPAPGQVLTADQVKQIQSFEATAYARINEARC